MASTICVRMKLSDFINTDKETEIMEMINKTHADLRITIFFKESLSLKTINMFYFHKKKRN